MRELVRAACAALGIRRLLLGVHDAALPGDPRDDLGRGAPLSLGGLAFLDFAARLGFDGVQLGPQGQTSEINASPYDGTIFARSTLSIALGPLRKAGLIAEGTLAAATQARPEGSSTRAAHAHAHRRQRAVLAEAFDTFERERRPELRARLRSFAAAEGFWLERDGLHAALQAEHGELDWLRWPEADRRLFHPLPGEEGAAKARKGELARQQARTIERHAFEQLIAHEQHAAFHEAACARSLLLFGDLQIGVAHQDVWSFGAFFLAGLRMGAPPSRTNPEGQPWSYAVLDPALHGSRAAPGPAAELLRRRVDKLLSGLDGLRIDHPHGLIDPWVYRGGQPDPLRAVQAGARLFSSPDLTDLPELGPLAIAEPAQLDRSQPRHADGWVRELRGEQVERYAILFDFIVAAAAAQGRAASDLVAEVLSTQPHPVARVLERHGLGRFRVTQKVALGDPRDVYRSENAAPADWLLVGNHDTEPIWKVAQRWHAQGLGAAHAAYLAERLVPDLGGRPRFAVRIAGTPERLALAKLAELFIGPGCQVMIFFPDLLGLQGTSNRPGTVSDENWSLRVPPGFAEEHELRAQRGTALDLPRALSLAFRARGAAFAARHAGLLAALEARAGPDPGSD